MTKTVSILDGAVGLLLAAYGVILVSGLVRDNTRHSGAAAAAMVLLMTLPVVWRRRAPVAVAAVLAAGAVLNPLVIGDMIRCGPSLPALLVCAYAIGRRPVRLRRRQTAIGLGCLLLSATVQSLTDPHLDAGVLVALGPMIVCFYGVGRLVRSRSRMAVELEARNAELECQKERRAELAVQADRARIADGLGASLDVRITEMGVAARSGRTALAGNASPAAALEAFETIQKRGRETLTHMRQVVGTLLEPEPDRTAPLPSLSQLDRLLDRGGADVHLHVTGTPRVLPAGVELSAYRILQHLLDAYGYRDRPRVDVEVDFTTEALAMTVRGPLPSAVDVRTALASAQARVDVHRGSITTQYPAGRWKTDIRLPL